MTHPLVLQARRQQALQQAGVDPGAGWRWLHEHGVDAYARIVDRQALGAAVAALLARVAELEAATITVAPMTGAERTARYRKKKQAETDVTEGVTGELVRRRRREAADEEVVEIIRNGNLAETEKTQQRFTRSTKPGWRDLGGPGLARWWSV